MRGEVRLEGENPPQRTQVMIRVRRTDGGTVNIFNWQVDAINRFFYDGLPPGEYELTAQVYERQEARISRLLFTKRQKVIITNNAETQVTITINTSGGKQQ